MGAWGHETFENDWALDWVFTLEESEDFSAIGNTQHQHDRRVARGSCVLQARAAAELWLPTRQACHHTPDEVQTSLKGKPMPTKAWVAAATKAPDRIMTDSGPKLNGRRLNITLRGRRPLRVAFRLA